jgi:hypothetical protein
MELPIKDSLAPLGERVRVRGSGINFSMWCPGLE